METAFHVMGWFSKIFKGSDSEHKVSEGQYDWRYGAEPVENNPSTAWVSICYIPFGSYLHEVYNDIRCFPIFHFSMPWRLILKLSMFVNLVREWYGSIHLVVSHIPIGS